MLAKQIKEGTLDFDQWVTDNQRNILEISQIFIENTPADDYNDKDEYNFAKSVFIAVYLLDDDATEELTNSEEFEHFVGLLNVHITLIELTKKGLLKQTLENGQLRFTSIN